MQAFLGEPPTHSSRPTPTTFLLLTPQNSTEGPSVHVGHFSRPYVSVWCPLPLTCPFPLPSPNSPPVPPTHLENAFPLGLSLHARVPGSLLGPALPSQVSPGILCFTCHRAYHNELILLICLSFENNVCVSVSCSPFISISVFAMESSITTF